MSIGIEVNVVLVRNHDTLWKSKDTRFSLGTVLPMGYNTPRVKFSVRKTKPGAVTATNAKPIKVVICGKYKNMNKITKI